MSQTSLTAPTISTVLRGIKHSLLLAIIATASADWLFYGHPVGISFAIQVCIIAACVAVVNPVSLKYKIGLAAMAVLAAALLPIIEDFSPLSLFVAVIGLCIYTLMLGGHLPNKMTVGIRKVLGLLFGGPIRIIFDLTRASVLLRRSNTPLFGRGRVTPWIVPLALGAVFLLLFRFANPLIEQWMSEIDLDKAANATDPLRLLFWLLSLALLWPFMRLRLSRKINWGRELATAFAETSSEGLLLPWLNTEATLYSLVLFNALFMVQTVLDIAYLWGNVALPEGFTYAEYAHRGAYILMFTALLAATFVLIALKPGGVIERSPWIRRLVYLWIGQNVLLVVSSMLRLNLYVEAYSLTYWRTAAFIWMLLVLAGLILIACRIALQRTNRWLASCNGLLFAATLNICAFVNFPYAIAAYNIAHRQQVDGSGAALDINYLCSLGPHAAKPIIEAFAPDKPSWSDSFNSLERCTASAVREHVERMKDWRAWTYRGWRLLKYFEEQGLT